ERKKYIITISASVWDVNPFCGFVVLVLHLVLPKQVIRESFNSNLTDEIAGLNSHSHSGAASFNRIASEIEHR
ncbi:hypothetical protein KJ974_06490, partial [bacterium]|nr:hypothetical protein [bacterium]